MAVLFGPASASSACHYHRVLCPFKYLSKDHPQHQWDIGLSDPTGPFDIIWVYGGQPLSNVSEFARLKREGVRIVYGLDDSFWSWPAWRHDLPAKDTVGMVNLMCELADLIVASTPALAMEIGKPAKTVTCPNLLEVSRYRLSTPPADDDVIRICWSGSQTHKWDLDIVDDALCRIKEKWGDKVEFHFFGACPDRLLRDHWGDSLNLTEWSPFAEYWYRLHCARPHITVAPLHDCQFNVCKSGIRVQEAWAMNSAVVASPVGEYALVEDGVDGLVATDRDAWFSQIDRLIQSRQLRESLASAGWERVNRDWNWAAESARSKWAPVVEAIDTLVK